MTKLKGIFSKNPEHVNQEHVVKAVVKNPPIYINPLIENNPTLRSEVEKHIVTIVTPDSIDSVRNQVSEQSLSILSSSYENGRVLESSEKIMINGTDYILTSKGVGTTGYYRETQAINPFMKLDGFKIDDKEKIALAKFPFYETAGTYDKKDALQELERSKLLQEMGIDAEIVLGIYELEKVMGPDGKVYQLHN